jgi:predicted MPP superfamily phosphohydrolase
MPVLPAISPLFLTALLFLPGLRLVPPARSAWFRTVLSALLCGLLDMLLLYSLPRLRLSFGPAEMPLFFFTIVRLIVLLPMLLLILLNRRSARLPAFPPRLHAGIQVLLSVFACYALVIEPFHLTVTRLQVAAPDFLAERPLRLVHLSDLHIEHPTRREQEVLATVAALEPDVILLTGDYLNPTYMDDPQAQTETRQFLAQLHAPYGVFAVNGTVDDPGRMSILFDGLENITVLADETAILSFPGGELAILGVTNTFEPGADKQALLLMAAQVPGEAYTLLLYHTPDLIETAASTGIDLYLAGHTHGGQIRLPFYGALVTFSAYGKQYEMGAYQVGETFLYVSRGLGMEGWDAPRMRFLCPPELEVLELGE